MVLKLILFLPFVGSIITGLLPANARKLEAWLAGLLALTCALLAIDLYPILSHGQIVQETIHWIPLLQLNISLRMDGFSWLFVMMITGMGALIALYACYYLSEQDPAPRFFSFFLVFMGAMLGVVLSSNLLVMTMFWELTSLSSFMLISYWNHRADARSGARKALIITGLGGLCLLLGVILLGQVVGSYELEKVLSAKKILQAHPWYSAILLLMVIGALTKSAQFPFQFWLPQAMAAPTPVSAYLHSATMVKAGIFLLVRLWPVFSDSELWWFVVCGSGLITLLIGAYMAMFQHDMKGILAYSTISHLGLIVLLLGMGSPMALVAAVFHVANHATFKSSLFMAAGIVDHETGTRDLRKLSGLYHTMPFTAILAIVASAAMAGVPLLNGFLSKEMFFAEAISLGDILGHGHWAIILMVVGAALMSVVYSVRLIHQVFLGKPKYLLAHQPHDPPLWMLLPSILLVLVCVMVGIFPEQMIAPILLMSSKAVLGSQLPSFDLGLWHGFNFPLVMSTVALLGGVVLYSLMRNKQWEAPPGFRHLRGDQLFEFILARLGVLSTKLIQILSTTKLQRQLMILLVVALILAYIPSYLQPWHAKNQSTLEFNLVFALFWLLGIVCAVYAGYQAKNHRLVALILLGVMGIVTAITFVWLSAPDLALTQLSVEMVTTVLFLLGLRWLPRRNENILISKKAYSTTHIRRLRDLIIALLAGGGLACVSYALMTHNSNSQLSDFFVKHALPDGGGHNVVNVILVDFRGFDTLGEISVLCIVSLIIYALLRRFRPALSSILPKDKYKDIQRSSNSQDKSLNGVMVIPAILARFILAIAMLVSFFFLLRGHDLPGGGFVAGLILAGGFILQYIVGGVIWVETRIRVLPLYWMGSGLLVAICAAVLPCFYGLPFLTGLHTDISLPLLGKLGIHSAMLFDIGVYCLVVGITILILVAIAHQSLRNYRRIGHVE